jgi:hypothetical protein
MKIERFLKSMLFAFAATAVLSGCGSNGGFSVASRSSNGSNSPNNGSSGGNTETGELGICSELSLQGVTWPSGLSLDQKRSLALALNISGSFEGGDGWSNLTNNFDNQGLSMGLLNQNLGQGSLQPLWIKMRSRYSETFQMLFSKSHFASLSSMLRAWEQANKSVSLASYIEGLPDGRLSALDTPVSSYVSSFAQEDESVAWAQETLYSDNGKTFQSAWKAELMKLGSHPNYVSLQIEAAQKLHTKALGYMQTLKLSERRSYLFLFDVVVQNGGLYDDDINDYKKFFGTSNPSETARLNKILELRLRHVLSEYKTDVRARKSAIITGSGRVHGSNRNFEKEYCYAGGAALED